MGHEWEQLETGSPTCTEVEAALEGGGGAMAGGVRGGDKNAEPRRRPVCQGGGKRMGGTTNGSCLGWDH